MISYDVNDHNCIPLEGVGSLFSSRDQCSFKLQKLVNPLAIASIHICAVDLVHCLLSSSSRQIPSLHIDFLGFSTLNMVWSQDHLLLARTLSFTISMSTWGIIRSISTEFKRFVRECPMVWESAVVELSQYIFPPMYWPIFPIHLPALCTSCLPIKLPVVHEYNDRSGFDGVVGIHLLMTTVQGHRVGYAEITFRFPVSTAMSPCTCLPYYYALDWLSALHFDRNH